MKNPEMEVHEALAAINNAWRSGQPSAMSEHLHPSITMALPGFAGTIVGRETLLASFVEFCTNARVLEYAESEEQIQVIGNVAVATYQFAMLYERAAYRERSTGRDVWVFERSGGKWIAVWRTMLDLHEERQT